MAAERRRGRGRTPLAPMPKPRGFERAIVGLMALGAVVFIEPAPFDLLTILLLPAALLLRQLAPPRASGPAIVIVGLFVLANLFSLLPARALGHSLRFLAITLYLVVLWVFVLGYCGKHKTRALWLIMRGWTIGATLTTGVAILAYFRVIPLFDLLSPLGRMQAFFKDPNVLGAYLVGPIVWSVSRLVTLERGRRLGWVVALIVCFMGVLLTFSRGAWISAALGLAGFFALRMVGRGSQRERVMTLLMVPAALVLLALALDRLADVAVIQDMLTSRFGMQNYDVDRFATQREALELAARTPFGIGPGQSEGTFTRAAHNTYVRGFVENGYLGGIALLLSMYLALFVGLWSAISSREPRHQVAMAVVAASLAAVCVESVVIDTVHWRHPWVLMAMCWTPAGLRAAAASRRARAPDR